MVSLVPERSWVAKHYKWTNQGHTQTIYIVLLCGHSRCCSCHRRSYTFCKTIIFVADFRRRMILNGNSKVVFCKHQVSTKGFIEITGFIDQNHFMQTHAFNISRVGRPQIAITATTTALTTTPTTTTTRMKQKTTKGFVWFALEVANLRFSDLVLHWKRYWFCFPCSMGTQIPCFNTSAVNICCLVPLQLSSWLLYYWFRFNSFLGAPTCRMCACTKSPAL